MPERPTQPERGRLKRVSDETFRSLRTRNFRLFFGGQLVSQVGNWLTMVAQTLLVLKLTGSGIYLGLVAATQFGPILVLGPWAGLVADRSDKRRLLITVQSIAMVQSFALAALVFSGSNSLGAIFAISLVGGITAAFDNPARRSFVVEMVPPEDTNNAVSLNSALMTSSRVVGPALAGLLVVTVGFGWAFLVDGISYIAVLAALGMMRKAELHPAPVTPRAKGQVRDGFRYIFGVRDLWVPMVMMAVIGVFAFNFTVVFPVLVTEDLGGDYAAFTILFSVLSFGSLLGALLIARRRTISARIVALTAFAFGGPMLVLAFTPSLVIACVIAVALGVGSGAFLTSSSAIVQVRADPQMRGRVLAVQGMVFLGSTPIGGPILGWISEAFGARWGVILGAIACFGAGVWGLAMSPHHPSRAMDSFSADRAAENALAEMSIAPD